MQVIATPKEGVLVRHENGTPLKAAGEPVERNSYWLRRERDGDVTLAPVPPADPEPAPAPAAAKKTAK
ncbi:DUF2635 domain-containing protein [Azonexus sp.]|uniref:DUF2635 domain-containing protein n=1 Tax=Azonexus sp. TaxID=1872668 RepID=UPI0035B1AAFA